ncbi:hypothetical protein [Planctomicrobium piriforme]|uniref:Uncharacterized protein n=1 Tax=Planctomicrobium piriforme TaxID=1576369 RepID=A0A1I3D9V5_9PLAN|nr:hypothetical protein [Planctomicrobium piriforme]SFH83436.1 hypothetical protein SAMN05421753_103148 [Planctomicrobium piriforme]
MIHYSCDLCGRSIRDQRYTAKIEVAAAFDPEELTEEDLEVDHLEQIAETLADMESTADFELEETGPKNFQFDMCPTCARKYLKAPLGAPRTTARANFSQN